MANHEDNMTDERAPGTSTDSSAQNMPSANAFVNFDSCLGSTSEPADEPERECELSALIKAFRLPQVVKCVFKHLVIYLFS